MSTISVGQLSNQSASTKSSSYVVFRLFLRGIGKNFAREIVLHQFSQVEEGRVIRDARGLLHIMRDDHDGEILLQVENQFLDLGGRNRVERGGRFIHQNNLRSDGDGARDAKTL